MPAKALNVRRSEKCRSGLQPIQAVLYVRVSSKDQEKEGFSIPAQIRVLREYAANRGLVVVREFEDIETAKASGRRQFNEMLAYLKRHHASCRTILAEKTDRLYRNAKDWVTWTNWTLKFTSSRKTRSPRGTLGRPKSLCTG
jgi:predicted site-specific integrase-resolvase